MTKLSTVGAIQDVAIQFFEKTIGSASAITSEIGSNSKLDALRDLPAKEDNIRKLCKIEDKLANGRQTPIANLADCAARKAGWARNGAAHTAVANAMTLRELNKAGYLATIMNDRVGGY